MSIEESTITQATAINYLMLSHRGKANLIRSEGGKYIFATDSDDYFCVELDDSGETVDVSRITINSGDMLTKEETISYDVLRTTSDNKKYLAIHSAIYGVRATEYYEVPDDFNLLNYNGVLGRYRGISLDGNQLSEDVAEDCMKLLGISHEMWSRPKLIFGGDGNSRRIGIDGARTVIIRLIYESTPFISVTIYKYETKLEEHIITLNKENGTTTLKTASKFYARNKDSLSGNFRVYHPKSAKEETSDTANQFFKYIISGYMKLFEVDYGQGASSMTNPSGHMIIEGNDGKSINIMLPVESKRHLCGLILGQENNENIAYGVTIGYSGGRPSWEFITAINIQQHQLGKGSNSFLEAIKEAAANKKKHPQLVRGGIN